ncbi:CCC motif membrane protein [Spongiimicrobium sp. 2-473A-2-J]|uniref:CCC motif membrane protein n=1 Tax=Eudoraea algarum TaxID=3417568 RepID=UPI003D367663
MEQQKLPNVTLAIVLVILGFVCCCIAGLPAAILGGIAFLLLRKDENKYKVNPDLYSNYSQLKTAKIVAIIVMVIGILYFAWWLFQLQQAGGWEAQMEKAREIMEQWGVEQ